MTTTTKQTHTPTPWAVRKPKPSPSPSYTLVVDGGKFHMKCPPRLRIYVFHDMTALGHTLRILRGMFPADYPATVSEPPWYQDAMRWD